MMKSICALRHKAGSDRAAFQLYYEESHAPLAIRHFPFARYVRNHLVDGADLGFDTISEFWSHDLAATAGLMDGPVGETLREDERRFMDQAAIAPAGAEELELSTGAPGDMRIVTLIQQVGDEAAWRGAVTDWGRRLAAAMPGVSIDFATSWRVPAFPAAALLWTPEPPGAPPAVLEDRVRAVRVRRCETAPETLIGNRR